MGLRFAQLAGGINRAAFSRRARHLSPACARRVLAPLASPGESSGGNWLVPARGHGGHSGDRGEESGEASEKIFRLGLAADVVLTVGKAITGYLSGSRAITADAAHSLSDIVLSGVVLLSYKAAKVPRDKDHPYGHGKFESLGALGISSMLLITAGGIAWHSFEVLQGVMSSAPDIIGSTSHMNHNHGSGGHSHVVDLEHPVLALSMTTLAISIKEGLYWITKRAGEKEGSGLMKANAWHHRADAISSVVALIGVGGSIVGLPYLDPLAGLVVSGMILKAGVETGYESYFSSVLPYLALYTLPPEYRNQWGCHRLRGRKAGTSLYLDVHIEVYPFLSVSAAHDIGETVRHHIQKTHNQVAEVFIHIDPSYSMGANMNKKRILENSERRNSDVIPRQRSAEAIVSDIISSHFPKKMCLEHLILHYLQGRVLLQVQVSMSPEILIRDAMHIAKKAEEEIMKADASICQVSVQLRLGQQIEQLQLAASKSGANDLQAEKQ
ncbi:hypothetical protein ZWY2020_046782 [Hordeum vulgare]|nr:hypothetical protein ZWY2020_046782 [Hordeum vulgare]